MADPDTDSSTVGAPDDATATPGDGPRTALLVPVEETSTLRTTVSYAVQTAIDREYTAVHFVEIASWRADDPGTQARTDAAEQLLDRVTAWATSDLADADAPSVSIESALLGDDEYLFSPDDYVRVLSSYADENGVGTVLLDPEYTPVGNTTLLQPLAFALSNTSLTVETARVSRPTRRERLRSELSGVRFAALFGVSFAFYLVLGDPLYWFDWLTGIASATIVAITLSRISFDATPTVPRTPMRVLRGAAYVPVLLFEIIKANLTVARVILDPRLPIDPTMNRVRVLVGRGLPLMTLANSITLTPGTLTVRARDSELYVQSLVPSARDGLFDGSLERWTRFIYYGRDAARLPTPRERDDVAILQGPDATEPLPIARSDGGETVDARETVGGGDTNSDSPTDDSASDEDVTADDSASDEYVTADDSASDTSEATTSSEVTDA